MKLIKCLLVVLIPFMVACSAEHNNVSGTGEDGLGKAPVCEPGTVVANCTAPDPGVDPTDPVPRPVVLEPNYESLRKEIFVSQCLGCHNSSGIFSSYDFSTYESITSYQKLFALPADGSDSRFVHSLVTGKMPREKPPLPPEQIEVIRQWVALGLPKTAATVPANCDLIDFATVNTQVFESSCTRCHDFSSKLDLQSYANIKQHLSKVQWAIANDKMPPKKPLSPELKDLVIKWIDQGAPETVVMPATCETKDNP